MNTKEALTVLGMETPPDNTDQIKAAFTEAARRSHPDSPTFDPAAAPMEKLIAARKYLLSHHEPVISSCAVCKGSGRVAIGFSNMRCTTCGGTGEKR